MNGYLSNLLQILLQNHILPTAIMTWTRGVHKLTLMLKTIFNELIRKKSPAHMINFLMTHVRPIILNSGIFFLRGAEMQSKRYMRKFRMKEQANIHFSKSVRNWGSCRIRCNCVIKNKYTYFKNLMRNNCVCKFS